MFLDQPSGLEMLVAGSNPQFAYAFNPIRSFKIGGLNSFSETYDNLTFGQNRYLPCAVAWNPSTAECWTCTFEGEIRAYDEWLTDFTSGGRLVTTIKISGVQGGSHAGGTGAILTRNDLLKHFILIDYPNNLIKIDMITGQHSYIFQGNQNSSLDINYIADMCPLGRGALRNESVCIIGTRLNGRWFIGEVDINGSVRIWSTLPIPVITSLDSQGGIRNVTQRYQGPWFDGSGNVLVSREVWTEDVFTDSEGVDHFETTGTCTIRVLVILNNNQLQDTPILTYDIPTSVNEIEDVLFEKNLIGGPVRTWFGGHIGAIDEGSNPNGMYHFRRGMGLFCFDRRFPSQNDGELENITVAYKDYWNMNNPFIELGSYSNPISLGPGTMPLYRL